nr:uroporphyrinogen-III synthase [uncultured Celeribacter sp.]
MLLITRPQRDSERLLADLTHRARRWGAIIAPVMEIVTLWPDPPEGPFDLIFLTSRHAVPYAARYFVGAPAVCVGQATAQAARDVGFSVPAVYPDAQALVADMAGAASGRAVHIHGQHARGNVAQELTRAGVETQDLVVYDQRECPWTQADRDSIAGQSGLILPVFSPRSATLLSDRLQAYRGHLTLIGLSQACLDAWRGPTPLRRSVAERPNGDAMKRAIRAELPG